MFGDEEVALVDLLDRLLAGGVVLAGDLTISLAGVDLVRISLRALITSIAPVERPGTLAARAERGGTQRSGADAPEAVTARELESGRG
ncbi:gas vesicle protein [Actinomycetospora flava]|uniref:Gas vesicle protein n=1 Tax=Actinomycetospora flava TaxID=3129232 RepID=A0ABU8MA68_9PSEU